MLAYMRWRERGSYSRPIEASTKHESANQSGVKCMQRLGGSFVWYDLIGILRSPLYVISFICFLLKFLSYIFIWVAYG